MTGIAFEGKPPAQGQTLILLGSNDGASWQELQRWDGSGNPMTVSDTKVRHYFSVQADAAAVAYRRFRLVTTTPSMRIRGVSDSEEDEERATAQRSPCRETTVPVWPFNAGRACRPSNTTRTPGASSPAMWPRADGFVSELLGLADVTWTNSLVLPPSS